MRLIVRRVKPAPGSQLALFATYSYHGFITDRDGDTLELEADHRRHAQIENAIRDLKYGVGLNHLPSGRFAANGAWLAVQVLAHNLARWTARIGLGEQIVTTKTLRRRFFSLAGRLTRKARRLTLHLPPTMALGSPVQSCPGPVASPATPVLTSSPAIGVPTHPYLPANRRYPNTSPQTGQRASPAASCPSVSGSPRPPQTIYRRQRSKIYRDSRSSGSLIPCSAISTTPFGGFGLKPKHPETWPHPGNA